MPPYYTTNRTEETDRVNLLLAEAGADGLDLFTADALCIDALPFCDVSSEWIDSEDEHVPLDVLASLREHDEESAYSAHEKSPAEESTPPGEFGREDAAGYVTSHETHYTARRDENEWDSGTGSSCGGSLPPEPKEDRNTKRSRIDTSPVFAAVDVRQDAEPGHREPTPDETTVPPESAVSPGNGLVVDPASPAPSRSKRDATKNGRHKSGSGERQLRLLNGSDNSI